MLPQALAIKLQNCWCNGVQGQQRWGPCFLSSSMPSSFHTFQYAVRLTQQNYSAASMSPSDEQQHPTPFSPPLCIRGRERCYSSACKEDQLVFLLPSPLPLWCTSCNQSLLRGTKLRYPRHYVSNQRVSKAKWRTALTLNRPMKDTSAVIVHRYKARRMKSWHPQFLENRQRNQFRNLQMPSFNTLQTSLKLDLQISYKGERKYSAEGL